jgi:NADP-reducing hydrogenase subunit HndD
MENMINLTIDGVQVSAPAGSTVLEAARLANIHIPTLCYLKDVNQIGACRVCVVDVGARALQAACVYPISEGMVVKTNTPEVRSARKTVVELLLSIHDRKCLSCVRNNNCELQDLCRDLGIDDDDRFAGERNHYDVDDASVSIVRDNFDLRPAGIIQMLDLRRPIYKQTSAYGHFGRSDLDLPWEKTDKAEALKKYA